MKKRLLLSTFLVALTGFLLPSMALAESADYSGEDGYQQFKTCSSWLKTSRSYNRKTRAYSSKGESLNEQIEQIDRRIDRYKSDMDSAEKWLSIQEAAGDDDGADRSVRKHNNARRKAINLSKEKKALVRQLNKLADDFDRVDEKHDLIIAKATRYCTGKTWTQDIIQRACNTYKEDTADYCEGFK